MSLAACRSQFKTKSISNNDVFIVRLSLTKPIRIKLQTKPFRQAQHDKVFRDALKIVFDRLKLTNKL